MIGWIDPVIVVTPSFLQDLSLDQMETILLHELAHIQRRDYPVNLAQAAVEALLFYQPVVWWISRSIRCEREYCCDDFALLYMGLPLALAKALIVLEEGRSSVVPSLSPAASRGDLAMRIRRILTPEPDPPLRSQSALSLVLLGLCTGALLTIGPLVLAQAASPLVMRATASNAAASIPQAKTPRPDMNCTYYKRIKADNGVDSSFQLVPQPGSCVDVENATGPFYCKQTDAEQGQEQSACAWKVQRLHEWQKERLLRK